MGQEDLGPVGMASDRDLYRIGHELADLGRIIMDLSMDGPRKDTHRARAKLAEIKAKLGVVH